ASPVISPGNWSDQRSVENMTLLFSPLTATDGTATIAGQTVSAGLGALGATGDASAAAKGQTVTASLGTLTATGGGSATATITGQTATASQGALSASDDA